VNICYSRNLVFYGFIFSLAIIGKVVPAIGQQKKEAPIVLENASFEGFPEMGRVPDGWLNCGRDGETPPDVQPGSFHVTVLPKHGNTYLGMVARDNETWESIGQRISAPLIKGHCYDFAIDMCRAEIYLSQSRKTGQEVQYTSALKILIWGGNDYCQKQELLSESSMVTSTRWLTFPFRLNPKKASYSYILFEAYYQTPVLFPYNGNVLLDNATIIEPTSCESKPEIPPTKHTTPALAVVNKPKPAPKTNSGTNATTPATYSTSTGNGKLAKAKKGEVVRLERITFKADSYELQPESEPALQEVYDFLKSSPDVSVEVGGHTNGIPPDEFCDNLSSNRAKNVANWLIQKGIQPERVQYKGYGKRNRIANDATKEGRAQNQRVEIKILTRNEK
jgi:outer membrane protein OmpA-like peptidoglycan-associated protein